MLGVFPISHAWLITPGRCPRLEPVPCPPRGAPVLMGAQTPVWILGGGGWMKSVSLCGGRDLWLLAEPAVIAVTRGQSPGDKSLTCSDRPGADGCW